MGQLGGVNQGMEQHLGLCTAIFLLSGDVEAHIVRWDVITEMWSFSFVYFSFCLCFHHSLILNRKLLTRQEALLYIRYIRTIKCTMSDRNLPVARSTLKGWAMANQYGKVLPPHHSQGGASLAWNFRP